MSEVLFLGRMTGCDLVFSGLPKLPEYGEDILSSAFDIKVGGSGNPSIAAAKMGLDVSFITDIGKDFLGDFMMRELEASGMNMEYVYQVEGMQSCVSAVLSTNKDRGFATFADTPQNFTMENIKKAMAHTKYVYTDLVHCTIDPIVEAAKEAGVGLVVDCCWDEKLRLEDVKDILKETYVFTANEQEAQMLTQKEDLQEALKIFAEYAQIAVVKLGSKGCIAYADGKYYEVPGVKDIEVVDTTGAGDSFGAGLLYGLLRDKGIEDSLKIGNAAGALAVTYPGGTDKQFSYENVMNLYEKNYK